jgi:hypothetical protein
MRYISNHTSAPEFIATLTPFKGSSMSGETGNHHRTGRMPFNWAQLYDSHSRYGMIEYTVFSWATPIAWLVTDFDGKMRWYAPAYTYSGYSSRHQTHTRAGIHKWCDKNGALYRDPETIVRGDEFYTPAEIKERVRDNRAMHTSRKMRTGTIRLVKGGNYMLNNSGHYGQVYDKYSRKGVWYAVVGNGSGTDRITIKYPQDVTVLVP